MTKKIPASFFAQLFLFLCGSHAGSSRACGRCAMYGASSGGLWLCGPQHLRACSLFVAPVVTNNHDDDVSSSGAGIISAPRIVISRSYLRWCAHTAMPCQYSSAPRRAGGRAVVFDEKW